MPSRTTLSKIILTTAGLAASALVLSACGSLTGGTGDSGQQGGTESPTASESGVSPMLFLGDSVAAQQAVAVRQAMAESGAYFVDGTSTGGGNLVGPNADAAWKDLLGRVQKAEGGVVVYQLTSYDWGTPEEQEDSYRNLAEAAADVDADLLLVSMPPIEPDEFYAGHMDELASAHDIARSVAEDHEAVEYLDASAVWGEEYSREYEGRVDRSEDGIHVCPQGAARFTSWLLRELTALYPEFEPAEAENWANIGWADDDVFFGCP
ncbi:SGNH/GDSL hydrolase family protein [Streptomyces sp. NPDC059853]|uniref:SGNH/GDSL hydrolase family protein n=1 Tax=Streptomyces sp. NPDC059853 TaxID=3346973 RepID=UPI0036469203